MTFTAFITTYALTAGIKEVRAELCSDTMVRYEGYYAHGNDWHRT